MSDTLLARIEKFAAGVRTALLEGSRTFTYADLDAASRRVAAALLDGTDDLNGDRVAFLVPPGLDYVAVLLGIWRAGGIAVPLAVAHSPAELRFVIEDCGASTMISTAEFASRLPAAGEATGLRVLCVSDGCLHDRDGRRRDFLRPSASGLRPEQSNDRRAMILYTSGTTGRPKGVVTTHAKIAAQI
ncbi:MAG TPA: AMP-binding protein, partial [Vicinamibacterales bacterium]